MGADNGKQAWTVVTDITWGDKGREHQRRAVSTVLNSIKLDQQIRCLVFGPTGCGKSSFLNGMRSAILREDHISHYFSVAAAKGHSDKSQTQGLTKSSYYNDRLWMIDMYGVYERLDMNREELDDIVSGRNVNLKFETAGSITRIHCIILVVKLGDVLSDKLHEMIIKVKMLCGEGTIQCHIVVTHIDCVTSKASTQEKLSSVFSSKKLFPELENLKDHLGVHIADISLVRNFQETGKTHANSDVLYLRVLEKILKEGKDGLERASHNP